MSFVRISEDALYALGCKKGQEVIMQVRRDRLRRSWLYVYENKTEKFIEKIRLKEAET